MDMLWGYGLHCSSFSRSYEMPTAQARHKHLFLFLLHRNHNERNRESCTIRHHHRSILYRVRRWNLSRLLFPAIQQHGHVWSCIRASLCITCAIFYYLDSCCCYTLDSNQGRCSTVLASFNNPIKRNHNKNARSCEIGNFFKEFY